MYEVFLKCWYQELPGDGYQEEVMYENEDILEAFKFLAKNVEYYADYFPIVEMGVRIKKGE